VAQCPLFLQPTLPAAFFEQYYSNLLFQKIRMIMDNTFGKIPFSSIYIFFGVMLIIFLKWFLYFFKEKPEPFLTRVQSTLSFFGFMITLFFILWGFNYGRIPLEQKLNLKLTPLSDTQLTSEIDSTVFKLASIRKVLKKDTSSIPQIVFINKIEDNSRNALNATLKQLEYPFSEKIRTRFLLDDMLLIFNIGGQYSPYTGEGGVDDAVFYSKKPFYVVHEMAHGNGFTQEADCNFLAYMSCIQSSNNSFQYSAEFNYLLYLLNEISIRNHTTYLNLVEKFPLEIKHDLEAYKVHQSEHTFKSGFLGDAINHFFLKVMGIQEGIKNYDKMVLLIYAWKHPSNI
jgi:hypothetical protein